MSSMMSPNPQTQSGTGGAGFISAPPTDDPNFQVDPVAGFSLPSQYMLPSQMNYGDPAPAGAFTDSQYYADDAALQQQIGSQYQTLLQQLGYQDPGSGTIIPGSIIQDANIQMSQYQQQLQEAARSTIGNLQNQGTLFSGQRPTQLYQAQYPTVQNEGQLTLNTGRSLQDIYHQAQGLTSAYNTQQNQLLAAAAQRNLAAIMAHPPAPEPVTAGLGPPDTTTGGAYSAGYTPVNSIPTQKITPTNFYTDVSLGAQSSKGGTPYNPVDPYYQSHVGNYGSKPVY